MNVENNHKLKSKCGVPALQIQSFSSQVSLQFVRPVVLIGREYLNTFSSELECAHSRMDFPPSIPFPGMINQSSAFLKSVKRG